MGDAKLKILLVSNGFYPEISPRSFRATELAKEFNRQGHDVSVFSKYRDHNYSEFLERFPLNFKMWRAPAYPVVPIFKRQPFRLISRAVSRLMLLFFEYPDIEEMFIVRKILKNENGFDLMISFAVPFPVQWGVASVRSGKNRIAKTWIADCGDPFMLNRIPNFRKPFYFKYLEENFCRKCDYLTIPYEELRHKFYAEFINKIRIIPQGFDFGEINLNDYPIDHETPVFLFAGSIIPGKRDLTLFLEYLSGLASDFTFIVYTKQMDLFEKYKLILGHKLEIRGYVDRLTLINEMSQADFLVNVDTIYDRNATSEAVPSKLIDYGIARRPILNINSEHLDEDLVMQFLMGDYTGQRVIDVTKFDIRVVSKQFLELIN